jgi:hypothetical protein
MQLSLKFESPNSKSSYLPLHVAGINLDDNESLLFKALGSKSSSPDITCMETLVFAAH